MPKYNVTITFTEYAFTTVDADSEEEARKKVEEEFSMHDEDISSIEVEEADD